MPEGDPSKIYPEGVNPTGWDTSRSREIFGPEFKYTDLEKSVTDTVRTLLELEKGWKQ